VLYGHVATLGNDLEPPTLRFGRQQETLDFQAKFVQDSKDWLALHDRNLIDRYKRVEIEIVIPVSIRTLDRSELDYYHLILAAIPHMRIGHREGSSEPTNGSVSTVHDLTERSEEFVFVPVTQFIQCP